MSKKPTKRRRKTIDPVSRPAASAGDAKFLEQVTQGRWLNIAVPSDVERMMNRLADHISQRAASMLFEHEPTPQQLGNFHTALTMSYQRGFYLAILRYENELKRVPELTAWYRKRDQGGGKGRATQSRRRQELAQRIRDKWAAMESAGEKVTNDTVAEAMRKDGWKCSRSTVIRAFKPAKR